MLLQIVSQVFLTDRPLLDKGFLPRPGLFREAVHRHLEDEGIGIGVCQGNRRKNTITTLAIAAASDPDGV